MEALYWLILIVILVIIELATLGLTTIWFAGGALVAFLAALLHVDLVWQVTLFLVVSIVLLIFTRPFAARYINKGRIKTNVDSLAGTTGIVQERINNDLETGKVMLNGIEWTARTEQGEAEIEPGRVVTVLRVTGVKLIVKEKVGG
ncbi:MAG TPA: NfeD family protein [Candidatus Merdenecus merdavium]|nr:NfeD family protein [Candidatus Merdenecus merdavium]